VAYFDIVTCDQQGDNLDNLDYHKVDKQDNQLYKSLIANININIRRKQQTTLAARRLVCNFPLHTGLAPRAQGKAAAPPPERAQRRRSSGDPGGAAEFIVEVFCSADHFRTRASSTASSPPRFNRVEGALGERDKGPHLGLSGSWNLHSADLNSLNLSFIDTIALWC
jgi:hypothetical protein